MFYKTWYHILLLLKTKAYGGVIQNKIKYYHGYIFDFNKKPIVGIKVYEENNFGGNLIVVKNDEVVLDTIWTVFSNYGETFNHRFVNDRNDTLFIDINKLIRLDNNF